MIRKIAAYHEVHAVQVAVGTAPRGTRARHAAHRLRRSKLRVVVKRILRKHCYLLKLARVLFLLADDAGAGKTKSDTDTFTALYQSVRSDTSFSKILDIFLRGEAQSASVWSRVARGKEYGGEGRSSQANR